jgi:hypothetical protein
MREGGDGGGKRRCVNGSRTLSTRTGYNRLGPVRLGQGKARGFKGPGP